MRIMPRRDKVAVVEVFGTIGGGVRSAPYEQVFERVRRSKKVKALVLDIDSPGGGVPASEYLYHSVAKVAEHMPVIASVRGVGASGAYMIACASEHIVANPGAIIGSIGVISVRPMLAAALEKLGIDVNVTKSGSLKDMGAFWRPSTPQEEAKLQGLIDESYERFVGIVAEARKLDEAAVRKLATGEVFWAPKALEAGLIDELGDLDTAVERAASAAGCAKRVVRMGPRKGFRQRLLGPFAETLVDSVSAEIERRLWVESLR
jgi:protease-4